jgi:hypothetical protein
VENAGLNRILHGNEYWYPEAESRRVRKEHGVGESGERKATNTFPKFPALPREVAAPMAKQDGHPCYRRKKGKTAGWILPAAGRPPLHKTKVGT